MITPLAGLKYELAQIIAATLKVTLYNNDVDPTLASLVGDFMPATFTGSAPQNLVWGAPFAEGAVAKVAAVPLIFNCTLAPGGPETIYGYIITDSTGTKLVKAHRFTAGFVIQAVNDNVPCAPMFVHGIGP